MKKSVSLILSGLIPIIFFSSCKAKIDSEKEKEAIKTLISNETQAFIQKDTAKLFSYYVKDDNQTRFTMHCDTFQLYRGWGEISALLKNPDFTNVTNIKATKDFIQVKIIGDAAWAIYKDNWSYDNKGTHISGALLCTMVLEKKTDGWKISAFSFFVPGE
jgi:ketosteroid isomerase-like protein